jgi:hypothetical protein
MPALTGFQKICGFLRLSQFFLHAAAETFGTDDGAFVQAAPGLWVGWRLI